MKLDLATGVLAIAIIIADHLKPTLPMKGIQFLINDTGEKTAVLIDLEQWGDLWEDFYDVMVSHARADEPDIDWDKEKLD